MSLRSQYRVVHVNVLRLCAWLVWWRVNYPILFLIPSVPLELSAVSSTTRLPDVTPYNNFNLTCTATAPEGVVAHKNFIWRKADPADDTCNDFTKVDGNMDSNLEQPVSTSVLNVTVSETDIGVLRFCCQASIAGVSGTSNNVLSIDVVGKFVLVLVLASLPAWLDCRESESVHAHFWYKVSCSKKTAAEEIMHKVMFCDSKVSAVYITM